MSADIERLAAANLLLTLAESFVLEASRWADAGSRDELNRSARQLAHIGRLALHAEIDLERAEAFNTAGVLVLRRVQGARKLAEHLTEQQQ